MIEHTQQGNVVEIILTHPIVGLQHIFQLRPGIVYRYAAGLVAQQVLAILQRHTFSPQSPTKCVR